PRTKFEFGAASQHAARTPSHWLFNNSLVTRRSLADHVRLASPQVKIIRIQMIFTCGDWPGKLGTAMGRERLKDRSALRFQWCHQHRRRDGVALTNNPGRLNVLSR